ncbi:MAG: methionyl-tRNA formyltransferase [Candidatus Omnitrophica bacterium]|nr:methionyl-tRNA formyltransferase [Candidatus Omnitrophota bacterium]
MKILFFGSSDFSLAALTACLEPPQEVCLVITTPPQKQGRGLKEMPNPVQQFAEAQKIPYEAPATLKNLILLERARSLRPDLIVVASYGKMIPSDWLKVPNKLCLNVHPSLLPKYRGAAPLNWPILNGDSETGMSIAEVTNKLDAGDIFFQEIIPIPENVNSLELGKNLAGKSILALRQVFKALEAGNLARHAQNDSDFTYAVKLKKENGVILWSQDVLSIHNQIRGLIPWPTAYTVFKNNPIQILKGRILDSDKCSGKPGEVISLQKPLGFEIQTGRGTLLIERLKPAGKKEMTGMDFINGLRLIPGAVFGS